jgi:hypothetical protein
MIKFEGSMDLCNSNLKSTKGYADRLSISMNNANETIPVAIKFSICISELPIATLELLLVLLSDCMYVSTSKREVTAIANVIAPFMSMILLSFLFL